MGQWVIIKHDLYQYLFYDKSDLNSQTLLLNNLNYFQALKLHFF